MERVSREVERARERSERVRERSRDGEREVEQRDRCPIFDRFRAGGLTLASGDREEGEGPQTRRGQKTIGV